MAERENKGRIGEVLVGDDEGKQQRGKLEQLVKWNAEEERVLWVAMN